MGCPGGEYILIFPEHPTIAISNNRVSMAAISPARSIVIKHRTFMKCQVVVYFMTLQ